MLYISGGPVVPSGNMSSPTAQQANPAASSHHMVPMVGYTTTGRPSAHQQPPTSQQPMSFTRALEISENLDQQNTQPPNSNSNSRYLRASNQQNQPQQTPAGAPVGGLAPSGPSDHKGQTEDRRDSVYDMNSYEISVWRYAHK